MAEHLGVYHGGARTLHVLAVGGKHGLEPIPHVEEPVQVEAWVAVRAGQGDSQRLYGRLGCPERERGQAGVDNVQARLDGLQDGHGSHSAGIVRVQLERYVDRFLKSRNQRVGIVGGHQAGHVLDAYAVRAHLLEAKGLLDVVVEAVDRAAQPALFGDRVADRQLELLPALPYRFYRRLQVAFVVEGVEYAEYVDPDLRRLPHECSDNVVGVVPIANEGLAPQQHHQGCVGHEPLEAAEAVPRVFPQEPGGGVEGRPAPDLHGMEADGVHARRQRLHVRGPETRGHQALMGVPERGVGYLDRVL